jgi:hypothetical protein
MRSGASESIASCRAEEQEVLEFTAAQRCSGACASGRRRRLRRRKQVVFGAFEYRGGPSAPVAPTVGRVAGEFAWLHACLRIEIGAQGRREHQTAPYGRVVAEEVAVRVGDDQLLGGRN